MKIAKSQLKQIIKEEYSKLINEVSEKPGMIYAPEPGGVAVPWILWTLE